MDINRKKDRRMKLSIIIPVYNVEKTLFSKCLSSILAEKKVLYEIILVDDGSNADCAEWCDKYASKYRNIKAFHKENGGVSSARNYGINQAEGEWVLFIDADDWIEKDALSRINKIACQSDTDIIFFGYYKNFSDKELKITSKTYPSGTVFDSEEKRLELQKK